MEKQKLTIVKVGGAVVEDEAQLAQLLKDFAAIDGRKVLVHGGGRRATAVAAQLGIETQMVGGRRITDAEMLDVVTMVYGGLVNKTLVARLAALGINAIGLTGADLDCIRSHRRPLRDGVDYGFVGDVDRVAADRLAQLVESGAVPVVAPLTHDGRGQLLNTNADTIASEVAVAMAEDNQVTLVYCFEKAGVLTRPDDEASVIPVLTPQLYAQHKADGTITGGMLPKLDNAFAAIRAGVSEVVIARATDLAGEHGTKVVEKLKS